MVGILLNSLTIVTALVLFLAPMASAQDKVSVRLKWFSTVRNAGFDLAVAKGFYKEETLEVAVNPGGPGIKAVNTVAAGSDTFGVVGLDQVLIAHEKGLYLVALMAHFQKSPTVWLVKKDSGIRGFEDFAGKRVEVTYGSSTESEYAAVLRKLGIDRKKVIEVPRPKDMSLFLAGRTDVHVTFMIDGPYLARKAGADVNLITPDRYGVDFYSDVIFARKDLVDKNPDLVRRFIRATVKGYKYLIEHPEEAVEVALKISKELDRQQQLDEAKANNALMQGPDTERHGLGWINKTRVQQQRDVMAEQGLLKQAVPVEEVVNTSFLEAPRQ